MDLSPTAERVLSRLLREPDRFRDDVKALGRMFRQGDLAILDAAYRELESAGLIEPSAGFVSFFGTPKPIYRLTEQGRTAGVAS